MMTGSGRVASPNRLSSDDEARSGLHPSGFDPARIGDLPERLFVAWLEESESLPPRVANLLEEAADKTADQRRTLQAIASENGSLVVNALSHARKCLWANGYQDSETVMVKIDAALAGFAIAMEAAEPDRPRGGLDPKSDSAGPQDIAQGPST